MIAAIITSTAAPARSRTFAGPPPEPPLCAALAPDDE